MTASAPTLDDCRIDGDTAGATPLLFKILTVVVIGYLSFGKSFAYLGLYPVYLGEILLSSALLIQAKRVRIDFFGTASGVFISLLLAIVAVQATASMMWAEAATTEIVRNTAFAYYALYALIVFSLASPDTIAGCVQFVNTALIRGAPVILAIVTVSALAFVYSANDLPAFPGTEVPILFFKATDASLILCIFIYLWRRGHLGMISGGWALALGLLAGARSRAALLSVLFALVFRLQFSRRALWALALVGTTLVGLWLSGAVIDLGGYRKLSIQQYVSNINSLADSDNDDPSTHKNVVWRTRWWRAIVEDCLASERIFSGRGWGSNLANDFGFQDRQADSVNSLRHPHNIAIGVLGRGGMIAAAVWCAVYLSLIATAIGAARKRGPDSHETANLCLLALVVGLINGLTDVYLESPQNAIPHWYFVGLMMSVGYCGSPRFVSRLRNQT
mgnify:CR=1 FL=1